MLAVGQLPRRNHQGIVTQRSHQHHAHHNLGRYRTRCRMNRTWIAKFMVARLNWKDHCKAMEVIKKHGQHIAGVKGILSFRGVSTPSPNAYSGRLNVYEHLQAEWYGHSSVQLYFTHLHVPVCTKTTTNTVLTCNMRVGTHQPHRSPEKNHTSIRKAHPLPPPLSPCPSRVLPLLDLINTHSYPNFVPGILFFFLATDISHPSVHPSIIITIIVAYTHTRSHTRTPTHTQHNAHQRPSLNTPIHNGHRESPDGRS